MQKKEALRAAYGLAIILTMLYGLYKTLQFLWKVFSQLNPTVGAGIIAATATVIVSVFSVLVAKHLEQKATLLKEHRERKTPVYEEMVKLIFRFAFSEKMGLQPLTSQEVVTKMTWLTENIIVWGSDDLLLAWNRFKTFSEGAASNQSFDILFEVETLLMAIRKDLGHGNKGIAKGKILGLFVNDIQQYLK